MITLANLFLVLVLVLFIVSIVTEFTNRAHALWFLVTAFFLAYVSRFFV